MTATKTRCIRPMEFNATNGGIDPEGKVLPLSTDKGGKPLESDAALFAAMRAGEQAALGKLYDRYSPLVYGLALRMLCNRQEAEDLTQEIFLSLWQLHSFDPARGSASTFLAVLTRSRALDKLRSRNLFSRVVQRWGQLRETDPPPPSPLDNSDLEMRSQQVRAALGDLTPQQQRVLEMAYFEGLSQSEIARQLGIPLGTIKSWCRQGLMKLRKNLQHVDEAP